MKLNLKRPLVFFDLETTGLQFTKDRIIEIAVFKVNIDNSSEERTWLINPEMHIPEATTAIHNITDEDVKDKPTFKQVAKDIAEFIGNADLAGYNIIKFDVPFLVEEFTNAGIDFNVSKRKFVDVQNIFHNMEQRTLKAAYKFYCGEKLDNAHEAMADTKATYEVFLKQIERYDGVEYEDKFGNISYPIVNDIDKLSEFTSHTRNVDLAGFIIYDENNVEVFNFGKHKRVPVRDVLKREPQYYDWIMKSDFPAYTKQVLTKIYVDMKKDSSTLF